MMINRAPYLIVILAILSSCNSRMKDGTVLFTQQAAGVSRVVAIGNDRRPDVITEGFASACSPDLSYDCRFLLFSGKRKENDFFQVWEMDLRNKKIRQVTTCKADVFDPVWLPSGQIVFSRLANPEDTGKQLFVCNSDGSGIRQITFDPYNYEDVTVLSDGRLLARRTAGTDDRGIFMILRPDGTKNMLFYKGENTYPESRAWITPEGEIYFVERSTNGSDIVSISYNRPLHSSKNINVAPGGDFKSVFPSSNGKMIVSYRPEEKKFFSLYEYDPVNSSISLIYESDGSDAFDPVLVEKKDRQKRLPSEVDKGVLTGQLLCQDVNFTGFASHTQKIAGPNESIRISGLDSTMGYVIPEDDGSVYIKVIADTPFRISRVDESGNTVAGPSSWMYLRPNERRGCTGCHEDPELVPRNQLSIAVRKNPVNIPPETKKILEKEIELE